MNKGWPHPIWMNIVILIAPEGYKKPHRFGPLAVQGNFKWKMNVLVTGGYCNAGCYPTPSDQLLIKCKQTVPSSMLQNQCSPPKGPRRQDHPPT